MNTINVDPFMWRGVYSQMKEKFRKAYDENMYVTMATNSLYSMFKYDEKVFRPELFEALLHDTGQCALIKTDTADYTPVFVNFVGGERYADGFFMNCKCYDLTGKQYDFSNWRENPEILVFFNNFTLSPDLFIDKYATMLAEVDTSIMNNVQFSREKPVPIAHDQKLKARIDQVFEDTHNGKIKTVLYDETIRDAISEGRPPVDILNITDVSTSQYIQYLSHLHDSLVSRLYFMMGLAFTDNGKQAQVSRDELNKNKSAALSFISAWYAMRENGFKIAREKTGLDWVFDYSDIWDIEFKKLHSEVEVMKDNVEDSTTVEEEVQEDESDDESNEEFD